MGQEGLPQSKVTRVTTEAVSTHFGAGNQVVAAKDTASTEWTLLRVSWVILKTSFSTK